MIPNLDVTLMMDGVKFWITCKPLKLLRKAGQLQLIQDSAPSTILLCQCDIRIYTYVVQCVKGTKNIEMYLASICVQFHKHCGGNQKVFHKNQHSYL